MPGPMSDLGITHIVWPRDYLLVEISSGGGTGNLSFLQEAFLELFLKAGVFLYSENYI